MKKLVLLMTLFCLLPLSASAFSDVHEEDWFYTHVMQFSQAGIIDGYADGSFRPEEEITNAAFVKLLVIAVGGEKLQAEGHWAQGYVDAAEAMGIVLEDEIPLGEYDEPIRRQRIARFTARALWHVRQEESPRENVENPGLSDWTTICSICKNEVAALYNRGIMRGYPDGKFYGVGHATRAEAVTVLARLIHPHLRLK